MTHEGMDATAGAPTEASEPRGTFWQRRVVAPLRRLMTQGVTPDKLALTLGVGTVCSLFPFLGTATLLNLVVGLWLGMNQPLMHALNQVLTPLHLVMILVYVRLGEWMLGASATERFGVGELLRAFRDLSFGDFLERFGLAGWHAFVAWSTTAPLLIAAIYFASRPLLRRVAARSRG